ncbi:MAG: hypothetical protein KC505_10475 [Myxococcales bacterium]|nr:hypothetical protein [Myxococcales bacterium]USN50397.1 MAG: hypothetical protein H6731_09055 [Myxococcales bacterium]
MRVYFFICFIFFSACQNNSDDNFKPAHQEPKNETTKKVMFSQMHTKYANLLKKALAMVNSNVFDKIRFRCDEQVIPWLENALDSLESKVPYTAQGAVAGMSAYKEAPKNPVKMIAFAIDKSNTCSIPDYIERLERTLDSKSKDYNSDLLGQESDLRKFIKEMEAMLKELNSFNAIMG